MSNNFQNIAETILGRDLNELDGMSTEQLKILENFLGAKLPQDLADFYLLVGNLKIFMSSFQEFVTPFIHHGKLIFLEENQGVCFWGIDMNNKEDQKSVLMCTNLEVDEPEWFPENVNLADFLKIIMYYQVAQGGYPYSSAVYESEFENHQEYATFLQEVTKHFTQVVQHNGLCIYQKQTKLIWHFTDKDDALVDIIFASTATAEDMEELEQFGFSEL